MARKPLKLRLALVVVALLWLAGAVVGAQDSTERLRDRIADTDRRVLEVERNVTERLVRIETNFETLSFWLKGIGGALMVQLVIRGLDYFTIIKKSVQGKASGGGGSSSAGE